MSKSLLDGGWQNLCGFEMDSLFLGHGLDDHFDVSSFVDLSLLEGPLIEGARERSSYGVTFLEL